ncbi:hypothetical protein [Streptomyces sp. AC550_RSS872]|uniref:hypothetical protein n=1 Tax=Streptomyces sp. AC550_RSS872 TaxID=2823689 RepID=UPI00266544D0|nr:hypothetical protein [Streptomyces sp. AC550_RSS872]
MLIRPRGRMSGWKRSPSRCGSRPTPRTGCLVEHPDRPIDHGLAELAELAADHAHLPPDDFVRDLADHHPSDGHDDIALLALRTPRG